MAIRKLNNCRACGIPITGQYCRKCWLAKAAGRRASGETRRGITIMVSEDDYNTCADLAAEMGLSVTQVAAMALQDLLEEIAGLAQ